MHRAAAEREPQGATRSGSRDVECGGTCLQVVRLTEYYDCVEMSEGASECSCGGERGCAEFTVGFNKGLAALQSMVTLFTLWGLAA
jgi:hypothetical protein